MMTAALRALLVSSSLMVMSTEACRAFDGIYFNGYGVAASGMGGVGIALPQDSLAGVNNPAGMAFVGTRVDAELQGLFINQGGTFVQPGNDKHSSYGALVGGSGGNYQLPYGLSAGVSFWGAGALNRYKQVAVPGFSKRSLAAISLYYNLTPTISWRYKDLLALGFGLNLAESRFTAQGIVVPGPSGLVELPAHNRDLSTGYGFRFGAMVNPTPWLSLGGMYATKTQMTGFRRYAQDLLADTNGAVDEPAEWGLGVAIRPLPRLTLGFDFLRVLNRGASAVGDPNSFHWRDQSVEKLGAAYELTNRLTVRAGYAHNTPLVDSANTAANILIPFAASNALTTGIGYTFKHLGIVDFSFEHWFRAGLNGTGASTGSSIYNAANVVQLQYGFKF